MRTKALKNLREKGAWSYPGTAQIFRVLSIIPRTGQATNLFCTYILSVDRNKSPLQILGKVAEDSRNFSGHLYIGCIARSSLR